MAQILRERTLALGGVFQSVKLVQGIARSGRSNSADFEVIVRSIFETDPESAELVYGGAEKITTGLELLSRVLSGQKTPLDLEVMKYAVQVILLEKRLRKRRDLLDAIRAGIARAQLQRQHFSIIHPNIVASLADLYVQTLSRLTPRIMVNGEQSYLTNPDNANRVRAALLGAIRSAVLWGQLGGRRWQFVFSRRIILHEARQLLAQPA